MTRRKNRRNDWPMLGAMAGALVAGWFVPLAWGSDWMIRYGRLTGALLLGAGYLGLSAERRLRDRRGRHRG